MKTRKLLRFKRELDRRGQTDMAKKDYTPVMLDGDVNGVGIVEEWEVVGDHGEIHSCDIWYPPQWSDAERQPSPRHQGHSRSWVLDTNRNRLIGCEGVLELAAACTFLANKNIASVEEQRHRIDFIDAEGKSRFYTPDFELKFNGPTKLAVEVKPFDDVEKSGIVDTINAIGDDYGDLTAPPIILTEKQLTPDRAWNAESVLRALKARNEADCDALRKLARTYHGTFDCEVLIAAFGREAAGRNAVWCLIYDQVLEQLNPDHKLIDHPIISVNHSVLEGWFK
ncbi:Tn7 transposase TnsA N-terminal domain-containing protein [Rhizobium leguminosarum]|uniref:Tn7 transposase TnsA N-terminal domain-containing protein n=1 Tax=Rhizobium leguminosarum TaxID=384 RepID=UPI003F99428E